MDYLLELGTEELPVGSIQPIAQKLKDLILDSLRLKGIEPNPHKLYTTPRRIALILHNLPTQTGIKVELIKGPPLGASDQAIDGFARKNEVKRDSLLIEEGRYCVRREIPAQSISVLLEESLNSAFHALKGERWMSWGECDHSFVRPVRWIVSLMDDEILPLEFFGVKAGRLTRPNRLLGSEEKQSLNDSQSYLVSLEKGMVIVDREQRRANLHSQIEELERNHHFRVEIIPELEEEVLDLLEYPLATVAGFEKHFLELPDFLIREILIKHQRYFPVYQNDKLSNQFVLIANCLPSALPTVIKGNQRVLKARLNDGSYFTKSDLKSPLADLKPKLAGMTFQKELSEYGLNPSMLGKSERLIGLALCMSKLLKFDPETISQVQRAAELAKCDLVSNMVYEFPEVQGQVGGFIALRQGEIPEVNQAISTQYQFLPQSLTGQIISLADKFENLFSLFLIGKIPTGSADPFALRRQALSIVNILLENPLGKFSLSAELSPALSEAYAGGKKLDFDRSRLQGFLYDRLVYTFGQRFSDLSEDLLRNFVTGNKRSPQIQAALLTDLIEADKSSFPNVRRVQRILKGFRSAVPLDVSRLSLQEEKILYNSLLKFQEEKETTSWSALNLLSTPIEIFFEKILIDDQENPATSQNRQALLRAIMHQIDLTYGSLDWNLLTNFAERQTI